VNDSKENEHEEPKDIQGIINAVSFNEENESPEDN